MNFESHIIINEVTALLGVGEDCQKGGIEGLTGLCNLQIFQEKHKNMPGVQNHAPVIGCHQQSLIFCKDRVVHIQIKLYVKHANNIACFAPYSNIIICISANIFCWSYLAWSLYILSQDGLGTLPASGIQYLPHLLY